MNHVPKDLVFPALFEEARKAICRKTSAPDTFVFGAILAAMATASAPYRFRVGHRVESPALWIALVGESGSGKTPALKEALRPCKEYEAELAETVSKVMAKYKDAVKVREARFKQWQKSQDCMMEGASFDEPEPDAPKFEYRIATDFTIEGLLRIHSGSMGVATHADELVTWIQSFSRYNSGSSRATWLTLFSGDTISQHRADVASSRCVRNPCVSVMGGIQQSKLNELKSGLDDGLTYRILFFNAEAKLTLLEDSGATWRQDEDLLYNYEQQVKNWMAAHIGQEQLRVIEADDEAAKAIRDYTNEGRRQFSDPSKGEFYDVQLHSMWSKLEVYITRLAGIYALMRAVSDGRDTATCKIELVDAHWAEDVMDQFIIPTSKRMIESIQNSDTEPESRTMIPKTVDALYRELPWEFEQGSPETLRKAREIVPQWANQSDATLRSSIRRVLMKRENSHLFTKVSLTKWIKNTGFDSNDNKNGKQEVPANQLLDAGQHGGEVP